MDTEMRQQLSLWGELLTFEHRKTASTLIMPSNETYVAPWRDSQVIPEWMKNYFKWHSNIKSQLNEHNYRSHKYLIMRCLRVDDKCGGASDRLQSLPWAILVANITNRILLIKWQRPADLEEFLVPPEGGLNWTVPDFFRNDTQDWKRPPGYMNVVSRIQQNDGMIVTTRQQLHDHGAVFYDEMRKPNEHSFSVIFRDVWRSTFVPSKPVENLIRQNMKQLNLQHGKYVAAHIRAQYIKDKTNDDEMHRNALNCAHSTRLDLPVYVASDSVQVAQKTVEYGLSYNIKTITRTYTNELMHIDVGKSFLTRTRDHETLNKLNASDFYDTFVDLYLLANSQCVAYGQGGYGLWAAMLVENNTCSFSHKRFKCDMVAAS